MHYISVFATPPGECVPGHVTQLYGPEGAISTWPPAQAADEEPKHSSCTYRSVQILCPCNLTILFV